MISLFTHTKTTPTKKIAINISFFDKKFGSFKKMLLLCTVKR